MPIDPRIALGGVSPAYDGLAAYRTARADEQTFRTNQMAQQAAQATAARNAMIQQRAAQTDFGDPISVRNFAAMGPGTEDYLSSVTAGDTMFTARDTNRRAESEARIKQDEAGMVELRTVVGRVFANPDDASLADAAQRYPQFAADINRIAANPDADARRTGLATLVASLPGGSDFLKAVTENYVRTNMGDRSIVDQTNPYAPGFTPPVEQRYGKNPNPVIVQTSQGIGSVVPGEPGFTPATNPDGTPVMPYQAPSRTDTADADARAGAAEGLRSTLDSLRGYYDALNRSGGIVSSGGVRQPDGTISAGRGGGENLIASAGASLPGRVLGRTFGSRDQTQRDNIQTAIPMIVASLKDLTGMSAQQMNSNVELQLFLGTVGDPSKSIETVNEALARFERYVDRVAGAQGGGAEAADPLEGRTAVGPGGQRLVRSGGQWVPQ